MPSIATHYIFSQDTALKLSSSSHVISTTIKNALGAYNAGAQGPDIFFYDICTLPLPESLIISVVICMSKRRIYFL